MTTWWKAAGIRAIKTMAQTAIASIGAAAVLSDVDWLVVASASAVAGILSLLTSVAGLPELNTFVVNYDELYPYPETQEEGAEEEQKESTDKEVEGDE